MAAHTYGLLKVPGTIFMYLEISCADGCISAFHSTHSKTFMCLM